MMPGTGKRTYCVEDDQAKTFGASSGTVGASDVQVFEAQRLALGSKTRSPIAGSLPWQAKIVRQF